MPITYSYKPEINLVISTHVGRINDDEFISFYKNLFAHIGFDASCNFLVDLRRAESKIRSSTALFELASYFQKRSATISFPGNVAVIAQQDRSFQLACIYEVFSNGIHGELEIFRDIPTALRWLNVPKTLHESIERETWAASRMENVKGN